MNWTEQYFQKYGKPKPPTAIGSMSDHIDVTGHLIVRLLHYKTLEIVQEVDGQNLVVNGGRNAIAHLTAGDNVVNKAISQMTFGDGTTPPAVTDTTLSGSTIITVNNLVSGGVTTHWEPPTFPASTPPTQVQFVAFVGQDDGNGSGSQNYTEAGLLCADGTLAARKVFGLLTKTSDLIVQSTWTFTF
jgi:hypothetical protein